MGSKFWDDHKDEGTVGAFIKKEEKEELIKDRTPLLVKSVSFGGSKYGPRYLVGVLLDGEERALAFNPGSVQTRDQLLDDLIKQYDLPEHEEITIALQRAATGSQAQKPILIVNPYLEDAAEE